MNTQNEKKKRPLLALILSALLPGLGQIYNEQFSKGAVLLGLHMIINLLLREPLEQVMERGFDLETPTLVVFFGYTVAGLILWIYAMTDAKRYAELVNSFGSNVN